MSEVVESRCRICSSPYIQLLNKMLNDDKYTLLDVYGVVKSLFAKSGIKCPSLQSLRRHKNRHILPSGFDSALSDFDPEHETLAHSDNLYESLIYALTPLSADEYDKVLAHYQAKLDLGNSDINSPIWTVERFYKAWCKIINEAVPKQAQLVNQRLLESIKKSYPKIQIK